MKNEIKEYKEYINKHQKLVKSRYEILKDAYLNDYKIYNMKKDLLKCTKNIKKVEINHGNTLQ